MSIQLKRIYEQPHTDDGVRILVDRIWPRGVAKQDANLDYWLKEVAPSNELRKWFNHDPNKYADFKKKYIQELTNGDQLHAFNELKTIFKHSENITLLYAAKDVQHNQAMVLKEILQKK